MFHPRRFGDIITSRFLLALRGIYFGRQGMQDSSGVSSIQFMASRVLGNLGATVHDGEPDHEGWDAEEAEEMIVTSDPFRTGLQTNPGEET